MGAEQRFRPTMMTALTTICGMVPVPLSEATSIGLSYTSFGLTLIGGLATSTFLTLLVVPVFDTLGSPVPVGHPEFAVRVDLHAVGKAHLRRHPYHDVPLPESALREVVVEAGDLEGGGVDVVERPAVRRPREAVRDGHTVEEPAQATAAVDRVQTRRALLAVHVQRSRQEAPGRIALAVVEPAPGEGRFRGRQDGNAPRLRVEDADAVLHGDDEPPALDRCGGTQAAADAVRSPVATAVVDAAQLAALDVHPVEAPLEPERALAEHTLVLEKELGSKGAGRGAHAARYSRSQPPSTTQLWPVLARLTSLR